ncbi:putative redox protein [Mucilaginibacter yixingensis]|uniref:Putative redox protein n=1 Tax=Mucilaginibacter yixingensis TaxID=1295612 RepID=A0A2T5J9H3_9SPHI|nr:OsmC family protein [Mucilaginibacter yixingensis]PTQ96718.1 putative redox protein [Mucilaginibacter yixingensis]
MGITNIEPKIIATTRSVINRTQYQTTITGGKHTIIADEPEEVGGTDTGMSPYELLLASLSSCTAITLQMYINRKMWVVEEIIIDQQLYINEGFTLITSNLTFKGDLTDEQKKRLEVIAEKCPVHKILTGEVKIETRIM